MTFIGIDGGGSKTTLLATNERGATSHLFSGTGVNPQRVGIDACVETLTRLINTAYAALDGSALRVYAGLAGAGRPEQQQFIADGIRAALPPDTRVEVTHDANIALDAAFDGEAGTMIIAGTGSVLMARTPGGDRVQSGGWGYLLGDEGSGTALGLEAVRALCRALDGGPQTSLVHSARGFFGFETREDIISAVYRQQWMPHRGARVVLEAAAEGDPLAQEILTQQVEALARQVAWLAQRNPGLPPRYVLLGGLAEDATYRDAFTRAVTALLPTWKLEDARRTPAEAALQRAFELE